MKIYTKTGDQGQTALATGQRISKSHVQLEAYGTADELNSLVGWLRAALPQNEWGTILNDQFEWIQNRLFDLGAILAGSDLPFAPDADIQLEQWMDTMQAQLTPIHAFILPYGDELISRCHICRSVTRRLERAMIRMGETQGKMPENELLRFVNRLSDFCFVSGRYVAQKEEKMHTFWKK